MGRLLFLILLVAAGIWLFKRLKRQLPQTPQQRMRKDARMVQCKDCGLYLPEPDAQKQAGDYYCDKHRR